MIIQDQETKNVIIKGLKWDVYFLLCFLFLTSFVFATIANSCNVCHKRLGHPNSEILSCLIKDGCLGNQVKSSLKSFSNYATSKLGKSKILLFPKYGSQTS